MLSLIIANCLLATLLLGHCFNYARAEECQDFLKRNSRNFDSFAGWLKSLSQLSNGVVTFRVLNSDSKESTVRLGFCKVDFAFGEGNNLPPTDPSTTLDIRGSTSGRWLSFSFTTPKCPQNGNLTSSAEVIVICRPEALARDIDLTSISADKCRAAFLWSYAALCEDPNAAPEVQHSGLSGAATFFLIVFILAAAYLLIGILYNRLVIGRTGLEQIPNYMFWRRGWRKVVTFVDNVRDGGQLRQPENNSYRSYPDDLAYDQPPLTIGTLAAHGTEDYNSTLPANRNRRAPDDFSDERLISP